MPIGAQVNLAEIPHAGPPRQNALRVIFGLSVLVAGSVVEQLALGLTGGAICQRAVNGGALGHLTAIYNPANGQLTITSSSGTETSQIGWMFVAF